MKKIILFLFVINCVAQVPPIHWQKSFGGTNTELQGEIKQTTDLGYIFIGSTNSNTGDFVNNHGGNDYLVIKTNALGVIEWQNLYGGSSDDIGRCIQQTTDGGYVIFGQSNSNDGDVTGNHGFTDYWILKLNSSGNIQWQKSIGGSQTDFGTSASQTSDGGYILAGFSSSHDGDNTSTGLSSNQWVVKLSSEGNIQWQKSINSSTYSTNTGPIIRQTDDDGYILGYTNISPNGVQVGNTTVYWPDIFLTKLDTQGNVQWQKNYGGSYQETISDVIQTNDLGYIIIGNSLSNNGDVSGHHGFPTNESGSGNNDSWVCKVDTQGNIEWQKSLGGSNHESSGAIKTTSDGGYILLASTSSNNGDVTNNHSLYTNDYWIVRLNNVGTILWQNCFGGTLTDSGFSLELTNDNGYILSGTSNSNNGNLTQNFGDRDIWIIKLSPDQLLNSTFKSDNLMLFPNPTSNKIYLQISDNASIKQVTVTNLMGKVILEQFENITQINTESLSSGIYFIEAFSDDKKYQSKFIKQ